MQFTVAFDWIYETMRSVVKNDTVQECGSGLVLKNDEHTVNARVEDGKIVLESESDPAIVKFMFQSFLTERAGELFTKRHEGLRITTFEIIKEGEK
jgi:hypothetical protein